MYFCKMDIIVNVINVTLCLLVSVELVFSKEEKAELNKEIMKSLCQYVGVRFVKNPEAPLCSYIACEDRAPTEKRCSGGLRVPAHFMWGKTYPCTQSDIRMQCDAFKRYMMKKEERQKHQTDQRLRKLKAARHWQMQQKKLAEDVYKGDQHILGKYDGVSGLKKDNFASDDGNKLMPSQYVQEVSDSVGDTHNGNKLQWQTFSQGRNLFTQNKQIETKVDQLQVTGLTVQQHETDGSQVNRDVQEIKPVQIMVDGQPVNTQPGGSYMTTEDNVMTGDQMENDENVQYTITENNHDEKSSNSKNKPKFFQITIQSPNGQTFGKIHSVQIQDGQHAREIGRLPSYNNYPGTITNGEQTSVKVVDWQKQQGGPTFDKVQNNIQYDKLHGYMTETEQVDDHSVTNSNPAYQNNRQNQKINDQPKDLDKRIEELNKHLYSVDDDRNIVNEKPADTHQELYNVGQFYANAMQESEYWQVPQNL